MSSGVRRSILCAGDAPCGSQRRTAHLGRCGSGYQMTSDGTFSPACWLLSPLSPRPCSSLRWKRCGGKRCGGIRCSEIRHSEMKYGEMNQLVPTSPRQLLLSDLLCITAGWCFIGRDACSVTHRPCESFPFSCSPPFPQPPQGWACKEMMLAESCSPCPLDPLFVEALLFLHWDLCTEKAADHPVAPKYTLVVLGHHHDCI